MYLLYHGETIFQIAYLLFFSIFYPSLILFASDVHIYYIHTVCYSNYCILALTNYRTIQNIPNELIPTTLHWYFSPCPNYLHTEVYAMCRFNSLDHSPFDPARLMEIKRDCIRPALCGWMAIAKRSSIRKLNPPMVSRSERVLIR